MATKILDLYAELTLDNSSYMEGVEKSEQAGASFEKNIKSNAKNTQGSFENLSGALSICKTALASFGVGFSVKKIVDGLSQAYEEANKLDVKLRGASTLYGDVAVNQGQLADNLKKISLQTGESLETLGQTVYDAMSAGVQPTEDMADVLKVVSSSSKLAKAGFTDTNTAMKASLSVINAYGMGIENINKVSDILLNTQNLGVTTVGELSNALSKVTPVASAFGVSIENVTSALALMTKQGTNTEVASTGLSSILSELGKSGTTASENLAKASESAGLAETSFTGLINAGYSLGDILQLMSDYAERNNLSLVDMFSSIEAGKSALQITNAGAKEFNNTLNSMETATGLVSESFEKMVTPSQRLDSAIATLKTTIGENLKPAVDSAKTALAELLTKMMGQVDYSSIYETTLNNLTTASENLKKAQKEAGDEINATTIAMQFQSKVDFWSGISKASTQYDSFNKTVKSLNSQLEVQSSIVKLNEETIENASKKSGLAVDELIERLALMKAGNDDVFIPYVDGTELVSLMGAVENLSANKVKVDELKAQIESAQSATESFVASLAEMVSKGVITVSDISLVNTSLANEVQKTVDTLSKEVGVVAPLDVVPQKFEEAKESVVEFTGTASKNLEWYGKAMDEYYSKLYGLPISTPFYKAYQEIIESGELTKVEIYKNLKEISEQYELTGTDLTVISQAKAEANREIWKNFATGFKEDMQSSFYSVMQSFETLGEALVNGDDMWESFSSIALKALKQILEALGNQLTTMAITKALMGDWVGAGFATTGAIFAYGMAGVTNAEAQKLLKKTGAGEVGGTTGSETVGSTTTNTKTEEERKQEQIAGLEEEANMLQSIIDNIETGAEIPEQYQQDVKIRELNDRIRELESKITSLQEKKDVTINQIIDTVPMTPYELEQQAYIMAERLQWS